MLQNEFIQSLEMQNESLQSTLWHIIRELEWGKGVCFRVHSWKEGQNIVVDALVFTRTNLCISVYKKFPDSPLALHINKWSNTSDLIQARIYLQCGIGMLEPDFCFITTVWILQWKYTLFLILMLYRYIVLKMKLKCINWLLLCKSSFVQFN